MVAIVKTATVIGVDAHLVEVEAELSLGLPYFSVIGLGGTSVQEARYRIQAALRAAGVELPHKKITVNLAPASLRKDDAALDLPMAISLLLAAGVIGDARIAGALMVGELALNGLLRPGRGTLSLVALARKLGCPKVIVPRDSGPEALAVSDIQVLAPASLNELLAFARGQAEVPPPQERPQAPPPPELDFRDVRGQMVARRALEIAAAGAHNLLLIGNPGAGKTMLARRMPSILPPLTSEERIEVTRVWSAAGLTIGGAICGDRRPFRSPHHTISEAGLIGGGSVIRPGEVSLAHHGVLFLDEMPELSRRTLEALRQPLEDREVILSRARHTVRLPAAFMLVGAANPCPCGWHGHPTGRCACRDDQVRRYMGRISGPLLDRFDMVVTAASLTADEITSSEEGEPSEAIRTRVLRAREHARRRERPSGEFQGRALRGLVDLEPSARQLLRSALDKLELTARGVERTLRVARTIADLESRPQVPPIALAEALRYRLPIAPGTLVRAIPP